MDIVQPPKHYSRFCKIKNEYLNEEELNMKRIYNNYQRIKYLQKHSNDEFKNKNNDYHKKYYEKNKSKMKKQSVETARKRRLEQRNGLILKRGQKTTDEIKQLDFYDETLHSTYRLPMSELTPEQQEYKRKIQKYFNVKYREKVKERDKNESEEIKNKKQQIKLFNKLKLKKNASLDDIEKIKEQLKEIESLLK